MLVALKNDNYEHGIALCRLDVDHDAKYKCDPSKPESFIIYQKDDKDEKNGKMEQLKYTPFDSSTDKVATAYSFRSVRGGQFVLIFNVFLAIS